MEKRNGLKRMSVLLLCGMLTGTVGCGASSPDDVPKENGTQVAVAESQESSEADTTQREETVTEDEQNASKVYEANGYLAEKSELLNGRMLEKSGKHFTFLYKLDRLIPLYYASYQMIFDSKKIKIKKRV